MTLTDLTLEPEALLRALEGDRYPGAFITFEGIEGCGKSTQLNLLYRRMESEGYSNIVQTAEPGGTAIGEELRALILRAPGNSTRTHGAEHGKSGASPKHDSFSRLFRDMSQDRRWAGVDISARTEAMIYAASRAQHVEQIIRPALRAGNTVFCDRYIDSSLAYQGGGRQLGFEFILNLHNLATADLFPDLTIMFTLDLNTSLKRARRSGGDRIEHETLAFHERVTEGFKRIEMIYPERVVSIDGARDREEIADDVYQVVSAFLLERGIRG